MSGKRILLDAQELLECLEDPDWMIVDCRSDLGDLAAGRRSYEAGHIPGAVFLDLDTDLAGPVTPESGRHPLPNPDALAITLGHLGIGNAQRVAVYDGGHGALAARAWWALRWLGHDAVYLLDGGVAHWQALGLPLNHGNEGAVSRSFLPSVRSEMVLSTEELAGDLPAIPTRKLLDARARPRFRGESEPIDPVAGHIPGAINLPFTEFVTDDGTWHPLEDRAALMEATLGANREARWSVMCGSGVTACHLAISGIEAGFTEPRLYVGSWSEWIRDPDRPIGVGSS